MILLALYCMANVDRLIVLNSKLGFGEVYSMGVIMPRLSPFSGFATYFQLLQSYSRCHYAYFHR